MPRRSRTSPAGASGSRSAPEETALTGAGRLADLGFTDMVVAWPRPGEPYAGTEKILEKVAHDVVPTLR